MNHKKSIVIPISKNSNNTNFTNNKQNMPKLFNLTFLTITKLFEKRVKIRLKAFNTQNHLFFSNIQFEFRNTLFSIHQ